MNVLDKKWVAVYRNKEFICIQTLMVYRSYAPDPQIQPFLLSSSTSNSELGGKLLIALGKSRMLEENESDDALSYISMLPRYESWIKLLMDRYEYKSRSVLLKNLDLCYVSQYGGEIKFYPNSHDKLEEYSGLEEGDELNVVIAEESEPKTVGSTLERCFEFCSTLNSK